MYRCRGTWPVAGAVALLSACASPSGPDPNQPDPQQPSWMLPKLGYQFGAAHAINNLGQIVGHVRVLGPDIFAGSNAFA